MRVSRQEIARRGRWVTAPLAVDGVAPGAEAPSRPLAQMSTLPHAPAFLLRRSHPGFRLNFVLGECPRQVLDFHELPNQSARAIQVVAAKQQGRPSHEFAADL